MRSVVILWTIWAYHLLRQMEFVPIVIMFLTSLIRTRL
jgi:hypothetical protein